MIIYWQIQNLVDNGTKSGSLIKEHFRYTTTTYIPSSLNLSEFKLPIPYDVELLKNATIPPIDLKTQQIYMADLQACAQRDRVGNYFTKIAVIAQDYKLRQNLVDYFQYYVLNNTGLTSKYTKKHINFTTNGFKTQEELFDAVKQENSDDGYCFAVNFKSFDILKNIYDIEFSFNKDQIPNTNSKDYNLLIRTPDFENWNKWFNSGAVGLYPYITEFIARSKTNKPDYKSKSPLYIQLLGYAPMKSDLFIDLPPSALSQLTLNFPFFFMIIYLIPFFYITSKLASEKESKAREGMKMMDEGLNFFSGGIQYQNYSFSNGISFLLGDLIFWTLLGFYLDQVVASDYGVSKPWNFFCKCKKRNQYSSRIETDRIRLLYDQEVENKKQKNFEVIPDSLKRQEANNECLKIRGLIKRFGTNVAVKGINMTMYNGQIFALLGHNGAGKTTTLSMLTGMIKPDEGIAEVFGIEIFNNMDEIRKNLGVCPQHDVLFDYLTPEDHLRLFASFKGTEPQKIESQVKQMLEDIDLTSAKNQISKNLSGGQKRKLSVAIAMIGDSKIVMLDEPTSGMDTTSRRKLWEMLKKNKTGKIIILTTHYMDEADILGDRIAIMSEGDVQCTGSSLFLKNRYGAGYNLIISKQNREVAPQIDNFIMSKIIEAKKVQEVSSEISYQLPSSCQTLLKNFFFELDQNLINLGIRSYGVGITTLEEVFLKIGHGEEIEQEQFQIQQNSFSNSMQVSDQNDIEDKELDDYSISNDDPLKSNFFLHTFVIMKKRILMQIRDQKTLAIDIIFPIILIFVGLALSTISLYKEGKPKEMTPFMFPLKISVVSNNESKYLKQKQIENFINFNYIGQQDSSKFKKYEDAPMFNFSKTNFFEQLSFYDDYIYNNTQSGQIKPSYGQIYVDNLNKKLNSYRLSLLLNSTSRNSVGAFGAYANTAILKQYLIDNDMLNITDQLNIKFTCQPFPLTKKFLLINKAASGTASGILMIIAWMMISDSLVQNIIKERQTNIKHQIMISGCSISAYWMGNYLADIILQFVPAFMGILGVHAFGLDVKNVEYLFLVTIFTNPAFNYFFSFLFDNVDSGSLSIKAIFLLFGIIAPISMSILQVFNRNTQQIADILQWFYLPIPAFSLSFGYISISNREIIRLVHREQRELLPYDLKVAGLELLFLLAGIPFYWILVVFFEKKVFHCLKNLFKSQNNVNISKDTNEKIDNDVLVEMLRVKEISIDKLPIRVNQIRKNYNNVVAIKSLSFGLEFGECFALLGVSGSGKSTCFKCLTGEIYPSLGNISICGFDVTSTSGFERARKQIGYCPQFDAIFEGLTVYEHLQAYACLKGIRYDLRSKLIERQIKDMDLETYRNIRANNLSGGNKRKLSVAIAMIGNPPLVFLDEPSTGVDPQAKRFMWNIVSKISTLRKKSAVIITTHSMEEAEALCTKMGIMVSGEFKCFGSSQYIKDKYGTGFEIEVKIRSLAEKEIQEISKNDGLLKSNQLNLDYCKVILQKQNNLWLINQLNEDGIGQYFYQQDQKGIRIDAEEFIKWQFAQNYGQQVQEFLKKKFQDFQLIENFGNSFKIKVSRDNYSIGFLFGMMEEIKYMFNISEYSVIQTTLEQIFNNFAIEAEQQEGRGKFAKESYKQSLLKSKVDIVGKEKKRYNSIQQNLTDSEYSDQSKSIEEQFALFQK